MSELAARRGRHMAEAMAMAPEFIARLDWDAERLAAHRTQALRDLVRAAVDRSPWHRKRLAGVCPDTLEVSGLADLPVMTKADLMANFDDIVTDDRLRLAEIEAHLDAAADGGYLFDRYTAIASGGSSGRRGVYVYDWQPWSAYWLSLLRTLLRDRWTDPALVGRPLTMAYVFAAHPSHGSAALTRTFTDPDLIAVLLPVTWPVVDIVAGLNDAQPDLLSGYPSMLAVLAHEAAAGRLRIAPLRVFAAGEPLLPEIRAAIGAVWPVPITNVYGTSEAGGLMLPCPHGTSHLAEDLVIVEPVDRHGRPVAPGERSAKLYVTNLINPTLPLIRFELTDEITVLADPCPCGNPTPVVADVQGRLDDWFRYDGVAVHPHVFRSALGRRAAILEYQVRQAPDGAAISVVCDGVLDLAELSAEIAGELRALGVRDPAITITATDRMERHPDTGKLRRFIPL